jgi:HK97 family phage prohead protease
MLTKAMKIAKDGITIKDLDLTKREAVIAHATYSDLDREGDRANKGMFTKSWNENFDDLRFFLNHKKELAPGKPLKTWEDDEHAYTHVYLGTHTLGEDVLKQMDEGIIVASSYGFDPVRQTKMAKGGYDMKEVRHFETSVLTHWGAHKSSGVVSVVKSFDPEKLKELNNDEKNFLRRLIANRSEALQMSIDMNNSVIEGSDMWSYINEIIGSISYDVGWLKRRLEYGVKEVDDLRAGVKAMEKFIRNTRASDECIQQITKELENTKQLLSEIDTAATYAPEQSTHTPSASVKDNEFLKQLNYSLLKVNTL